ncbi:MAG: PilZ domain-containing protein [Fibromonadaceae bacterium]|nr:PilZ domain-containing protein [Fibromonadaceae bacterium]
MSNILQSQGSNSMDSVLKFDKFSQSLHQGFSKNFSIETILIFVFLVIILVISLVLYEIHRSNKARLKLLNLAWQRFNEHVGRLKLNSSSISLLSDIAGKANLQDPYSIVKSPHVFESSLENFYESEKISSMSNETLASIRELRKVLEFLPLSREIAFTSTRQFEVGEKCFVLVPDSGPPSHKGLCAILSIEEKKWSIEHPEGSLIPVGTWAKMNLTRGGDAEYSFKSQVLSSSDGQLVLSHACKLNRAQQRNWVRVDVNIPVEVIQVADDRIGDMFYGTIVDMSGGGFGMALPAKLSNGTTLKLNFELPGQGPIADLAVKVVRVAGSFKNDPSKIIHSVAFDGDVVKVQEQVTQYVFEKQRQDAKIKQN